MNADTTKELKEYHTWSETKADGYYSMQDTMRTLVGRADVSKAEIYKWEHIIKRHHPDFINKYTLKGPYNFCIIHQSSFNKLRDIMIEENII